MKEIIAACGNICNYCPRFLPKSDEELNRTAYLWYKIGYRESIVPISEIGCTGCKINNQCRYQIIQCVTDKKIENCGQCKEYPCEKINEAFTKTMTYKSNCKRHCTLEEYQELEKSFFRKKENLDKIAVEQAIREYKA